MNTRKLKASTIKRLKQIIGLVIERPDQIDMESYFNPQPSHEVKHCGTTACIAGWAITLKRIGKPEPRQACRLRINEHVEGWKALGIAESEADRLFYEDSWPENFKRRLARAGTGTDRYARVVADRILHFIKTNGAE